MRRIWPALCLSTVTSTLAGLAATRVPALFMLGGLAMGGLALVGLLDAGLIAAFLLFARPSLEAFSRMGISVSEYALVNVTSILALVLLLSTCGHVFRQKPRVLSLPLARPFIFMLVVTAATVPFAPDPFMALRTWAQLLGALAMYVLIASTVGRRLQAKQVFLALLGSGAIPIAYGCYQLAIGQGSWDYQSQVVRFGSFFGWSNAYAEFLLVLLVLSVCALVLARGRRLGLVAIVGVLAIHMYLTRVRGVWFGVLALIFVLGLLVDRRIWLAYVGIAALVIVFPGLLGRFAELYGNTYSTTNTLTGSDGRLRLWLAVLNRIPESPIIGHGLGSFAYLLPQGEVFGAAVAHNDYLRFLVEGGVLGLAGHLWLLATFYREGSVAFRRARDPWLRLAGLALSALVAALATISTAANVFPGSGAMWSLCAMAGIVNAVPATAATTAASPTAASVAQGRRRPGILGPPALGRRGGQALAQASTEGAHGRQP